MKACLEKKLTLSGKTYHYECELISLRNGIGVLRHVIDRNYDIAGFRLSPGDEKLAVFWTGRSYTLYKWHRKRQNDYAYYLNIADSVSLTPDVFVWRDLAVDVLVDSEGSVHVLDEHELPHDLARDLLDYIMNAREEVLAWLQVIIKEADALLKEIS